MKEIRNFWKDEKINELINQTSNDLDEDKQNVRDVISDLFLKLVKHYLQKICLMCYFIDLAVSEYQLIL